MIKHKYNAIRTERDGIKFSSKAEARRYDELVLLKRLGTVVMFLMQTPFHLPGSVKYVSDFVVFWSNGEVTVEDVKGKDTPMSIAKRKIVEAIYPVVINLVKRS